MTLRVVLDTNVVLSSLLFNTRRLAWIRQAWQMNRIRPIVCKETASELLRVLAYPKFKLTQSEQEELLNDFLPYTETFILPDAPLDLPVCRDPDDQPFLALAKIASVDLLVTGDADLLSMRDDFVPPIITADELRREINPR
jgi:putative PIN family toxin of toxin-antitoxin system